MKRIAVYLFLMLLGTALYSSAASVRISIDPPRGKRSIQKGDIFFLSIQVSNTDEVPQKPQNIGGAKLMYFDRTMESSGFSSVNGVTTQTYSATYTATLRAEKEGSFSYGPITVGGQKSNKVNYTIGGASANLSSSQGSQKTQQGDSDGSVDKPKYIGKGDGNLFLRATVSTTNAYEQQAIVYTVKLYTTYDAIKFVGATESPKFDGFVVEESKDISSSLSFENYQGKSYATAVIARYIIFPQMTGSLKVTGNKYTIAVDRREYFHDSFFGNLSFSTPLQLNVTPNDLVINVKSLPEPKPADFSGAVGKFKLTSDLKNTDFKSNQAGAIEYVLEGTGNIKYVQLPDLSALYPPELEIYTPVTKQDVTVGSTNVSGKVSFDYSFMPLEEGDFRIPDVRLVYFNTETGRYENSVAKGYTIHVGKGTAAKGGSTTPRLKFISDLQKVSGMQKVDHTPMVYSWRYWLILCIPLILLLLAIISYKKYVRMHSDITALRSRRADKIARKRLRKAYKAMRSGNRELFYNELLVALWGYLGDKLKMPTSELMRDNIRQVLASRGMKEDTIGGLIAVIDDAEFAKYSSSREKDDMQNAYSQAASVINSLDSEFKNVKA